MIVKLLTEQRLKFLSLRGGCRGPSESTHVKMPHCWKSHALAHIRNHYILNTPTNRFDAQPPVNLIKNCPRKRIVMQQIINSNVSCINTRSES